MDLAYQVIAADGPDWGIGAPSFPIDDYSTFIQGRTIQMAANYGTDGSFAHYGWVPVDSIDWTPGARPAFTPELPAFNEAPHQIWDLEVVDPKQLQVYLQSQRLQQISAPVVFTPPGLASISMADLKG